MNGGRSTRERIIDAALKVFGERGYSGATTREIADVAGVNEVTLFRQFDSKLNLYAAVVGERSPIVDIQEMVDFDVDAPLEEIIYRNARIVLDLLISNKHLFMMTFGDAWRMPEMREVVHESGILRGVGFLTGIVGGLMENGKIRPMDPEIPARAIIGLVQSHFLMEHVLGSQENVEEDLLLRGFASILASGLRTEGSD